MYHSSHPRKVFIEQRHAFFGTSVCSMQEVHIAEKKQLPLDVSSLFTNVPLRKTIDYIYAQINELDVDSCQSKNSENFILHYKRTILMQP